MPELDADFEISNNNLQAEYEMSEGQQYDCSFEIYASGTVWGNIEGEISNQTDLKNALDNKADVSTVENLSETVNEHTNELFNITNTIDNFGDIVEYNASDFASSEQGEKAETALQPGDDISKLVNDVDYITSADLSDYATKTELNDGLAEKQDTINDLSEIRSNAENGQSAYTEIQSYGDIVTYNADNFATSIQGGLADTALQPNDNITELNNNAGYITSASLPTVNNNKITIQKNSTEVGSFNLNQSTDKIINLTVPTQASDINAVPTSRKINNNALSSDISLTASDVGALPSTTSINDLTSTAQQNALNSGATSTNISQIGTNASNISDIQDLIPTEATPTNQLADKNFVNSSVATNTANFIGTFQSVADLEAYSGTLTNNDYAFVETTDTAGNTLFDRYKYTTATTPAIWQYEYELNNSSFTATQWSAINSGANSTNIGQIAINTNDIQSINTTIDGYGNIVTHNTSEFATSVQGGLADTALQPNDSISLLTNDSGYITGINSNDVISALGYTPYDDTNPDGYITSINSSDVTNALGYTPYDSSNPNGYTSNAGTVTSVNNILPVSGNVTLSIPSKISDLTDDTSTNPIDKADTLTGLTASITELNYTDGVTGAIQTQINGKQDTLVSGTNIKTVNGNSLLGDGDITVGGSSYTQGTGISITNQNVINHSNSVTAGTAGTSSATSGSTLAVPYVTYDAEGHITASGTHTHTVTGFLTSSSTYVASSRFDGQWTYKYSELTTATSTGSRTHSLSSYLPDATYDYEVLFYVHVTSTGSTTYAIGREASPFNNAVSANCAAVLLPTGSNGSHNDCTVIYKISKSNQNVYSQVYNATASSSAWIRALGYRRIGTNS